VCLGLFAAGLNFAALRNRLEPEYMIAVNRTIAAGERIREVDLQAVAVPQNAGNSRHFWQWESRQQLLGGTTASVRLDAGDLIPRDVFLRESEPLFRIPEGYMVVCVRLREDVITRELRYRLRPGRLVSVLLAHETEPLGDVRVAFVELVPGDSGQLSRMDSYQVGLLVKRDSNLVSRLATGEIASLATMSEGS